MSKDYEPKRAAKVPEKDIKKDELKEAKRAKREETDEIAKPDKVKKDKKAKKEKASAKKTKTENGAKPKKKKSKKKIALIVILSIIGFFILAVLALAAYVYFFWLPSAEEAAPPDFSQEFVVKDEDKIDFAEIDEVTGNDFKSILKNWATNGGEKMYSKNVINVLLIGSDASSTLPGRSHVTDKGNTDVMMVVSIDKVKKTVKLVSFMRDSYLYMDGYDSYQKLNAACMNGGPNYLVQTIENNYKFKIDGYILVDFDSFQQVIDTLGGVNVDVPQVVANHFNRGNDEYKGKKFPSGNNVLLDGEQALAFSRVRKIYSNGDVSRVQNQRAVINGIINKCKGASLSQIVSVLDILLENVRTDIGKNTIISYATQAVTDGWAVYPITQLSMPDPTARCGYSGSAWIWVIDYPLAAQNLQKELYGETNIKLEENRKTAIDIMGLRPEQKS